MSSLFQTLSPALPMGAADYAAEISPREAGILVGENIGLHIAEGSFRLVFDPVVEGLDDVFFETRRARIGGNHCLALRVPELVKADAQHVHLDARSDKGDNRVH